MTSPSPSPTLRPNKSLAVGIDPGAVNLGYAVVEPQEPFKVHICELETYDPRKEDATVIVAGLERDLFHSWGESPDYLTMERFVPYSGSKNDIMEEVNQVIGMFRYMFTRNHVDVRMVRAVEWKTTLVKLLNKHCGFENPSKTGSLDKVFSLAAARFITTNPELIKNDHEADAVCLAALPYLEACAKAATSKPS